MNDNATAESRRHRECIGGRIAVPALILACMLSGCGSSEKPLSKAAVAGEVTFNGQPMTNALIAFVPQGNVKGPRAMGMIADGKFSLAETDGPVVGKMRVEITSALEEDEPREGKVKPFVPERIPAQYNVSSTLSAEVKAAGANAFRFDLIGPAK